ncbi:TetR/AcrR family transcriptional regulator [Streptomyces sp. TRM66268-LWL]|uniref:TetR/AcrR family transcriptional regulator n=1 Tax=Streptomyces polyasparticus TaxID=2767826 RepID=A0ABR7SB35_9ACTN|nr:TetR/AcrR family transcriptional regulator [Streptomyces polyasparticus]MBC9711553.1 TetR/AcrR family transcriptional regulator [Streptomyces polyasparticus]
MGHREDLLEGAKRCLLAKGFMRTTARDIVKESGTNLASIGYHYGSKDVLLAEAYIALISAASERWEEDPVAGFTSPPGSLERFEEVWTDVITTVREPDSMWRLSIEIIAMGDQMPTVRDYLAKAQSEGGRGFIAMLMGVEESTVSDEETATLGKFLTTLMTGLIAQYSFAPETAPTAQELTEGLRRVIKAAAGEV